MFFYIILRWRKRSKTAESQNWVDNLCFYTQLLVHSEVTVLYFNLYFSNICKANKCEINTWKVGVFFLKTHIFYFQNFNLKLKSISSKGWKFPCTFVSTEWNWEVKKKICKIQKKKLRQWMFSYLHYSFAVIKFLSGVVHSPAPRSCHVCCLLFSQCFFAWVKV